MASQETDRRLRRWLLPLVACLLGLGLVRPGTSRADRGGWHLSTQPVKLTESGQRAIIGWDGRREVLCLATDVSASRNTKIIEFLPLPAEPRVKLGDLKSFKELEKLLAERHVRFTTKRGSGKRGRDAAGGGEPFTITFHQRLGAHDVTVVRVNSPEEFADWLTKKAKELGGDRAAVPPELRRLIRKYVVEYNCPYFVFDVIEVGPDPKSVEPIIYEFDSEAVWYPLEISRTFQGRTTIDLVVFSEGPVHSAPLRDMGFKASSRAEVSGRDMERVLPELKGLLGESAFVQAFRYAGKMSDLSGNVSVGLRKSKLVHTRDEYEAGAARARRRGLAFGVFGGLALALLSLWPMYLASRRQQPRWGRRLLAGFLAGMPLGFLATFAVPLLEELGPWRYSRFPDWLIVCAMGLGFVLYCFQLGLRRRWYCWGLLYLALGLPAAGLTDGDVFWPPEWGSGSGFLLVAHLAVFALLFLSARLCVWVADLQKRAKEQENPPRTESPPGA